MYPSHLKTLDTSFVKMLLDKPWGTSLFHWIASSKFYTHKTHNIMRINYNDYTHARTHAHTHAHTHTRLTALFPGLPGWAGTRKVKPIWILLKQETVSGSGISWAICMSASRSRQITTPAPQHSVFYRPDALPAAQPTASKHWRHKHWRHVIIIIKIKTC